jgi:hypothetical protein
VVRIVRAHPASSSALAGRHENTRARLADRAAPAALNGPAMVKLLMYGWPCESPFSGAARRNGCRTDSISASDRCTKVTPTLRVPARAGKRTSSRSSAVRRYSSP